MSKFRICSLFTITLVLAYAAWAFPSVIKSNQGEHATPDVALSNPKPCTDAAFGETCTLTQSPFMLAEYLTCSSKAAAQVLNQSEVIACMQAYLAVKLSFISGVELGNYQGLPPEKRGEINRRAFKAYRKWKGENPNFVITPSAKPIPI